MVYLGACVWPTMTVGWPQPGRNMHNVERSMEKQVWNRSQVWLWRRQIQLACSLKAGPDDDMMLLTLASLPSSAFPQSQPSPGGAKGVERSQERTKQLLRDS